MAKVIISKTNNLVTVQTTNRFVNYETGVLQASAGTSGGRIILTDTDTSQKVLNNFDITQLVDSTDTVFGATVSATVTALNAVVNAAPDTLIKSTDKVTALDGVTASDFTGKSGFAVIVDGTDLNLSTSGKLLFNNHNELKLGADLDLSTNKIYTTATNGDIELDPNGTGDVKLGNYTLDGDQSVGSGQDNYVLTYDHSSTKISLEEASSGGTTINNNADNRLITGSGTANTLEGEANLTYDGTNLAITSGTIQLDNNQAFSAQNTSGSNRVLAKADTNNVAVFNAGFTQTLIGGASGITLSGPVTANEIVHVGSGISSAGNIGRGAETTVFGGSGGTSSFAGRSYYYTGAAWAVATQSLEAANKGMLGIALGSNTGVGMCLKGFIKTDVTNLTPGSPAYMNTNATITTTVPSTSGNFSRIIGYAVTSDTIFFNPSQDWVKIS
jgi:hypothetical protein